MTNTHEAKCSSSLAVVLQGEAAQLAGWIRPGGSNYMWSIVHILIQPVRLQSALMKVSDGEVPQCFLSPSQ